MKVWFVIENICILVLVLCLVMEYRSKRKLEKSLIEISDKLSGILAKDTDEKVMIFTENKKLIALLMQTNRMLENRQKIKVTYKRTENASKKMLSNISHDIKTPLTVILGYLEIMRMSETIELDMVKKVEKKANQVMELINTFFTLSKIEAGDMDLSISRIQMNEVCRRNVIDFYEILSEKEIEVEIKIPDDPIYVYGNENAIDRIITNLISNAIRYGSEGKYLGIHLYQKEHLVILEVKDKGKGIEPDAALNVFDRLYTMDDSRNKEIQGNGLGLTIAKSLAEKIGGELLLESHPYESTVFRLQLKQIKF